MRSDPMRSTSLDLTAPDVVADPYPHFAHSATPYAAFSTLQPVTTRPSTTVAAAPTEKCEYGA